MTMFDRVGLLRQQACIIDVISEPLTFHLSKQIEALLIAKYRMMFEENWIQNWKYTVLTSFKVIRNK